MFSIDAQRLQTGLILIGVLGLILFFDNFYLYWLLFAVVVFVAVYEAAELLHVEHLKTAYILAGILVVLGGFVDRLYLVVFLMMLVMACLYAYNGKFDKDTMSILLYPLLPLAFCFEIITEYPVIYFVWVIVVVAGCDIGAYVIGRQIGKTPFCATSPNKTLEGVIGGLALAGLLGSFIGTWVMGSWVMGILISLIVGFFSIFGDLFESFLKRQAGVKDSGDILPGHGGVLDRIDAALFALPTFYVLMVLM